MHIKKLIPVLGMFLISCNVPSIKTGMIFYEINSGNSFHTIYSFSKKKNYRLDNLRKDFGSEVYTTSTHVYDYSLLYFLVLEKNLSEAHITIYDYIDREKLWKYSFDTGYKDIDIIDSNRFILYGPYSVDLFNRENNSLEEIYRIEDKSGSFRNVCYYDDIIYFEVIYTFNGQETASYISKYSLQTHNEEIIMDKASGLCISKSRSELLFVNDEYGILTLYSISDNSTQKLNIKTNGMNYQYCFLDDDCLFSSRISNDFRNRFQLFSNQYRHVQVENLKRNLNWIIDRTYSTGPLYDNPVYFEEDITDLLDDMEN